MKNKKYTPPTKPTSEITFAWAPISHERVHELVAYFKQFYVGSMVNHDILENSYDDGMNILDIRILPGEGYQYRYYPTRGERRTR